LKNPIKEDTINEEIMMPIMTGGKNNFVLSEKP
jgi:hypothetical protein